MIFFHDPIERNKGGKAHFDSIWLKYVAVGKGADIVYITDIDDTQSPNLFQPNQS